MTPAAPTVFVRQTQVFTATGTAVAGAAWTAPGGTPAAGAGATLTTQWTAVGNVVVTAACNGTSHTATAHVVDVEIEVGNTPAVGDDAVRVKQTTPAERPIVHCRIRMLGTASAAQTVVLTNPDGRLRFPTATTTTVTLPISGAWVAFDISGETVSAAIGDAKIEVHLATAAGALLHRKDVTVFEVQVEVNNTPAVNDDVVPLQWFHPPHREVVHSRIRITPGASAPLPVLITNPDSRLRFPSPADATLAVTLAANGAWSAFDITGETASAARGDAKIEVHHTNAAGEILARRDLTVFTFDPAHMTLTQGGEYHLVGGNYTAAPVAVRFSAAATIKPAGLDCTVPQIANLKISIMQESSNFIITKTWTTPVMAWNAGVAAGTTVNVPPAMRETTTYAAAVVQPVNDGLAGAGPLYSRQAGALMPPTGCAGGGAATSSDTPGQPVAPTFAQVFNVGGAPVGTVTWTVLAGTTRTENFRTYCVVINTVTNVFSNLKEAIWTLAADSTHPHQHVTVNAETAAGANPAVGVQANFAANTTVMAGVGAAAPIVHP